MLCCISVPIHNSRRRGPIRIEHLCNLARTPYSNRTPGFSVVSSYFGARQAILMCLVPGINADASDQSI